MKTIITLGLALLLAGCTANEKPNEDFGPYPGEKSQTQKPKYK